MNPIIVKKEKTHASITTNNSNKKSINMENLHLQYLVPAVVYSIVGIVILLISFWIIEKITPENLWQEIIGKQNTALAILASAFMIAIALIISSAIHG